MPRRQQGKPLPKTATKPSAKKRKKKYSRTVKAKAPVVRGKREIIGGRERWLTRCAELMQPWVVQAAAWEKIPLANRIPPLISCSWPAGRSEVILSQTVINEVNSQPQIAISPLVGRGMQDEKNPSLRVALQILHELIHIAAGPESGHREAFAAIAEAVGFRRPLTQATPTPDLADEIQTRVLARIGDYPHVATIPGQIDAPGARKQRNRQRKYVCSNPECGQIIRCGSDDLVAVHCCEDGKTAPFILVEF